MSTPDRARPLTLPDLQKRKAEGKRLSMITCYDSAFARLIDRTPIDVVLVGDSLGNVMLGHANTIPVTMAAMVHHTAAVSRALRQPFLVADMPFLSYPTIDQACANARLLMQVGAKAVKLEGGHVICPQIQTLVANGVPVMGHLGLTPQSVNLLGGYKVQGKTNLRRKQMIEDARILEVAGVFALVLEMVPADLAREITAAVKIPTIGIGAGPDCDGQVLVLHDLLGFDAEFNPKFLKKYVDLATIVSRAVEQYDREVKAGIFPTMQHSYTAET